MRRKSFLYGAAATLLGMSLTSCQDKTNDAGMLLPLDSTGKPVKPKTPYEQWLTDKPSYVNFTDQLQLAIPPQHQQFWLQKDIVPRRLEDMPKKPMGINSGAIAFHFFMPDFSGFTPENYDKEFHPDHVYVLIEAQGLGQEQLGMPGGYPENIYRRMLFGEMSMDLDSKEIVHGLECFRRKQKKLDGDPDSRACYGIKDDLTERMIQLDIMQPPYPNWVRHPIMQAAYFSPDHGGVRLMWRTHMKHFPRWKEIDQQIWRWIGQWNIAKPTANTPSATKP
jgi:hypothetical protein